MRAVKLTGPKQLEMVKIDTPVADGEHVLVNVTACGICGSDLHYWEMGVGMDGRPGLILGHEFAGTVSDPGSRGDLAAGDRVTVLPLNPCGKCAVCMSGHPNLCPAAMKRPIPGNNSPGAFAEALRAVPAMVRKLPDTISDAAAALVEPAAVALHVIRKAGVRPGDRVLVTGGGPIGLLCAAWAKISGAAYVALTEISEFRRSFARDTGWPDGVFDAADPELKRALKKAGAGGFDIAVETSAADAAIGTALTALRSRGRLVLAGISFHPQSIPTLLYAVKEIEQRAALGYHPDEFDMALDFLSTGRLDAAPLITRTIGLDQVKDAFVDLAGKKSRDIKVVIRP